jgi:hypothetical protein
MGMKQLEVPLGTGTSAAGCRSCGRVFTGVTAFDRHQRLTKTGLVCLDPADIGLERKPSGQWGQKMTDAHRARLARLRDTAKI